MKLYDHLNKPILLGEEVGRGGEGLVYTIQGDTTNVAKVYHKTIASEKAEKLRAMVANSLDLTGFTAWPSTTLHDQPGSMIKGFIMPRVSSEHREVHELYGPAHRKMQFPHADWSFLIHAARNVAAAFQSIHDYGHTIGDVNQSGILISQQALCRLIDTDSFQIRLGSRVYHCEVGTPHFTPPELQRTSFRGILRKENHDNFGLAVIIFQLLFMGRHPFAGRYSGSGDMPIEKAIQEYRFAFGAKASTKQMAPPPNALDLSVCTSSVAKLFERAFSEEGIHAENRPKAQDWVKQLDILRNGLCSCKQNSAHKYHKSLSFCPWCSLEYLSGTVYFLADTNASSTQSKFNLDNESQFNLEDVWTAIRAVKIPSLDRLPDVNSIRVRPTPLPDYAKYPQGFFGLVNLFVNFYDDRGEHSRRRSILREAEQQWETLERQYKELESDPKFSSLYQSFKILYNEYKDLPNQYRLERNSPLLKSYLERHFIENAEISNIGKQRALALSSYGIETAADVTYNRIISVPSFGPMLTQKLVDWRTSLEQRFQQHRPSPNDFAYLNSIDQKYARRRSEIENKLIDGKAQLVCIRDRLLQKREQVRQEAENAAKKLAQAKADVNAM